MKLNMVRRYDIITQTYKYIQYILGYHQRCVRILPVMHKLSCYRQEIFISLEIAPIVEDKGIH